MIYLTLFYEFFKIGLFAVGGGAATIPFLFDLTVNFDWFTAEQLANMIAVAESTPGPIGINMATFAGFQAAGILGGLIATIGLALPSVVIVILISNFLQQYACDPRVENVLASIRPAVLALVMFASWQIAALSVVDLETFLVFILFAAAIRIYKKSPIFYILLSALVGIILEL